MAREAGELASRRGALRARFNEKRPAGRSQSLDGSGLLEGLREKDGIAKFSYKRTGKRSRLRNVGRPVGRRGYARARREDVLLLLRRLQREIYCRSGKVSGPPSTYRNCSGDPGTGPDCGHYRSSLAANFWSSDFSEQRGKRSRLRHDGGCVARESLLPVCRDDLLLLLCRLQRKI